MKTVLPEMSTRAEVMWAHESNFISVECEMEDILPDGWQNYTHDSYDSSVEIYGIDRDLTDDELDALGKFGFWACWTHSEIWPRGVAERHNKERNKERHYSGLGKRPNVASK